MLNKLIGLLFMATLVFSLSATSFAQDKAKEGRVEGRVQNSNKDKSTLTVRSDSTNGQTMVNYDASTKWVSQYHGEKKAAPIEADDVKDGDYVICRGSYDEKRTFHATLISKRLSHSSQ